MSKTYLVGTPSIKMYSMSDNELLLETKEGKTIYKKTEEPIKKEINLDMPVLELVKKSSPPYELMSHPLISKYGFFYGRICESWIWEDKLEQATELELWKILGLINTYRANDFYYWYEKEKYELETIKNKEGKW